jgi:hypothetical protein
MGFRWSSNSARLRPKIVDKRIMGSKGIADETSIEIRNFQVK